METKQKTELKTVKHTFTPPERNDIGTKLAQSIVANQ